MMTRARTRLTTWWCLLVATLMALLVRPASACPTNETLYQSCGCESSHNGILLDCSDRPVAHTLAVLRQNQPQLGLIQQLTLRNASVQAVPAHFLQGLYVKKLDLSMNQISKIDPLAFKGLENILQSLLLSHNNLTEIPTISLDGMAGLLTLDVSNNSIGDLENIKAFRNVPKLFDLNLGNNRICSIQKSVFDSIKHSVQTLNLGHNCLSKVPAPAIRGFQQVIALHLHNNQIGQLDPLEFMNLPLLNLINLSGNNISSFHRQAFLNVPNLRLMYLSNNQITSLESNQFRHFTSLELLDLTENQISTIPSEAFANMPRLSYLYLGQNLIKNIEPGAFRNATGITILLMPGNKLTKLSPGMFTGLTNLQQFNVKNNNIEQIDQNSFYQMPNVVMLDLSYNRLAILPPATFLTQLNMFLVDLSHNQLLTTPYSAFNKRVMTVVLQENPLVCNERVHMLQNGVGVYVPNTVDVICGGTIENTSTPAASNNAVNTSVDDDSSFVQATKTTAQQPPRTQTIIRPISTVLPPGVAGGRPSNGNLQPNGAFVPRPTVPHRELPPFVGQRRPQVTPRPTLVAIPTRPSVVDTRFTHFSQPGVTLPPRLFPERTGGQQPPPAPQNGPGALDRSGRPLPPNPDNWYTRPPIPPLSPVGPGATFRLPNDGFPETVTRAPQNGRDPPTIPVPRLPSPQEASGRSNPAPNQWDPNGNPPNLANWNPRGQPFVGDNNQWNRGGDNRPANVNPAWNPNVNRLNPGWNPSNNPTNGNEGRNVNEGWNQNGFTDPLQRGGFNPNPKKAGSVDTPQQPFSRPTEPPFGAVTPGGRHPFPVPFLSRGTPVRPAYYATTPTAEPTLPPGIILATAPQPPDSFVPEFGPTLNPTTDSWESPRNFATRPPNPPWQPNGNELAANENADAFRESNAVTTPPQTRPNTLPPVRRPNEEDGRFNAVRPTAISIDSRSTPVPQSAVQSGAVRTVAPPKKRPSLADPFGNPPDVSVGETFPYESPSSDTDASAEGGGGGPGSATTTIAICLSVVVVVMVGVFVTLCVVRHRSYARRRGGATSLSSGSSAVQAARTSAYVAAQAAQMNYATANYASHAGGTLSRMPLARSSAAATSAAAGNTAGGAGQHTWIYTPGSYTSASNYYK